MLKGLARRTRRWFGFCAAGLWDEIGYCEAERLAFKPMLVTEEGFTEDLLIQHTEEAANLQSKFETMRHILEVCCML